MMSICNRFGEQGIEDIVEEFKQENFVVEYQDVFEGLRVRMERVMPELDEAYFN